MHCNRFIPRPLSRREMLLRCANGFGAVALASLLSESSSASSIATSPLAPRTTHFTPYPPPPPPPPSPPKARPVFFLSRGGAPSQLDTFDPKPRLDREHGKPIQMK